MILYNEMMLNPDPDPDSDLDSDHDHSPDPDPKVDLKTCLSFLSKATRQTL